MKKITLIVPDTITRILGSPRGSMQDEIEISPENLVLLLTFKADYHEDYGFPPDQIKVVSIESIH